MTCEFGSMIWVLSPLGFIKNWLFSDCPVLDYECPQELTHAQQQILYTRTYIMRRFNPKLIAEDWQLTTGVFSCVFTCFQSVFQYIIFYLQSIANSLTD